MEFGTLPGAWHSVRPYRRIKLDHDLCLPFSSTCLGVIVPSCEEDDTTEAGILPDGGSPVRLTNGREACSQASECRKRFRWMWQHRQRQAAKERVGCLGAWLEGTENWCGKSEKGARTFHLWKICLVLEKRENNVIIMTNIYWTLTKLPGFVLSILHV